MDTPKLDEAIRVRATQSFLAGSSIMGHVQDWLPTMDDVKSFDDNSALALYTGVRVCEDMAEKMENEEQLQEYKQYEEQLLTAFTEQGRDVEKLSADSDYYKQRYYDHDSAMQKINDVGTYGVDHPELSLLPEDKFLTENELRTLDGEYVSLMSVWANTSKDEAHRRAEAGEDFDTTPYDTYYDLVFNTFEDEGFNRSDLEDYSKTVVFSDSAQEKLKHMMENPAEFPPEQYLLTTQEIHSLSDEDLLEQFALAKFCTEEKARYSHDHTVRKEQYAEDAANGNLISEMMLHAAEMTGDPGADGPMYGSYYQRLKEECVSRGYTEEQLERDAEKYITAARGASLGSLFDKGTALNLHMLACMNDADEQALYYYMSLTPQEREMEPRFKSVLTGETKASHGAGRWDGARRDRDPLESNVALTLENTTHILDTDDEKEGVNVQADLMAVMNAGTEYEVKTYSFTTAGGLHLMYCQSPYLGNFTYNGNDWGVGYKEIPDTDAGDGTPIKVPVLEYVGDLEADWEHGQDSPLGMIGKESIGDIGEAAGTNLLKMGRSAGNFIVNSLDFFGLIEDDPIGKVESGYTREQQVSIPYGVKNLDYTFAGNTDLQLVPGIPSTVTSMHCTFMNCTEMWEASNQFGYGSTWKLPSGLEDASYTFAGCRKLECKQIGKMPEELLTIEGMFYDCSTILEKKPWDNWTLDLDAIFGDTVEADWSDDPYLMEQFAKPINENTSNTMKKNYEHEEKEREAFQAEFSKPENIATLSQEQREKWQDAKAADAAVRTVKVLNADMTVPSIDEMSYNAPEKNDFKAFLQRAVIDVGTFAALKGVTGMATKSKLAGWAAGLGGTALLRLTQILPESIEPALQWVKKLLPESAQGGFDKFISWIHIPQKEDYEAADRERMTRYAPVALNASMSNSVWSADIFYDDKVVKDAMKVNGKAVAEYGVFQFCGEEGRSTTSSVKDTVNTALSKAESVFDRKMQVAADGNDGYDWNKGDGYDWKEEMRRYYKQMLGGVEGYSEGGLEGIDRLYNGTGSLSDKVKSTAKSLFGKGESEEETQTRKAYAQYGLSYANCDYTASVMDSLKKMDDKYHFMTPEDWIELGSYNIYGVDTSELSAYQVGQGFEPVFAYGTEPVVPATTTSEKRSESKTAPSATEEKKSTIVKTESQTEQSGEKSVPATSIQKNATTKTARELPADVPNVAQEEEPDYVPDT